ncbi:phenylalanine--tRNA ligase subunit beta [Moorena sp. SIO4G3]|uniref:phenylalanine--tRNA ligase subunit beta n=1 Tax=Moorena sp. SIO4G3 TaxID=2607821 RepID=UPI00142CA591|nr:phenylalanine--tRNA ligase subunit beta [Moorena sp. SIO4G3]NEO76316.1 phenylalanine--tRNA ligase subunit beta [Moorena sp. SIO4G3]
MRISLNWLRELVEVTLTPEELAQTLTMAGFEVEDIEDLGTLADGVVIGKVLEVEPHPNANKLRVCQVDIGGSDPLNIVCGASNVRPDIYVPVATIGTYLPTIDLKIRASKLRGVRSEGMICSLAEVGLAKESAGIHIFEAETIPLGSDARPLLGLTDIILDVTSTANRADALSMVGVAREVVALTGVSLSLPEAVEVSIPKTKAVGHATRTDALTLKVSEPKACPAYIGTVIEGVKIAPSPDWLQQRLKAAGVRPINNVVDVTNLVLLEWGQPLHAFDRERLQAVAGVENLTIGVRFANSGESLTTLDGQTRSLEPQALLITANDQPVAMAGVMGGEATEVNDNTQSIVLEAALFDPVTIRRSSRSQSIRTESSARYERGVNQAELDIACKRAIALITELAGGTPTTQSIADQRPDPSTWARSIELRLDRVNRILGPVHQSEELGEILPEDVEKILTALGCQLQPRYTEDSPQWKVTVPPYRYRDLEREIDLIEEIARLYGYDNFCDSLPDNTEPGYLSAEEFLKRKLRSQFRAVGLTELVQYSLVKPEEQTQIRLDNPLFTEYSSLRTDLLSGLIDACQYNIEQGNGVLNGFEIGRIFWRAEEGFAEADAIAGILGGNITQGNWVTGGRSEPMTWYEAKGVLERVFSRCGLTVEYQPDHSDPRLHPGRTASLWLQGEKLGKFGQLHPQLRSERGFPDQVYVFDLDLELILEALDRDEILTPRFQVYSTYPAIDRDIAFFAPLQVSVAEIERSTRKAAGTLLESVELFDEYKGESVPEAQRSLAFRLIYRASDRTLTDAEVEPVHQKVREALEEKFGVSLRS